MFWRIIAAMAERKPPIHLAIFINGKALSNILAFTYENHQFGSCAKLEAEGDEHFEIMRWTHSGESFPCRIEYKDRVIEADGFEIWQYSHEMSPQSRYELTIRSNQMWRISERTAL